MFSRPLKQFPNLLRIRHGQGNGTVICFHAIGGMIASYGKLFRQVPKHYALYGVEAPRDSQIIRRYAGMAALTDYYAHMIWQLQPSSPICLGGWCLGADLALLLYEKLLARGFEVPIIFGIDANLSLRARQQCDGYRDENLWRFLAKILVDGDQVDTILSSVEFQRGDTAQRIESIYQARDRHPGRSPIKRDRDHPTWQYDFIKALLESSSAYPFKSGYQDCTIYLFSDRADQSFVLEQVVALPAERLKLTFFPSDHRGLLQYPMIRHIMGQVMDALAHHTASGAGCHVSTANDRVRCP